MLLSRRQPARCRRGLAAALVVAALPALSGCASGFDSPVLQRYNPAVGIDVRKGGVWGMNLLVVLPESGGQGTLVGALLNKSAQTDRLVSASVRAQPGEGSLRSTMVQPGLALRPGQLVEMSDLPTVTVEGDVMPGRFVDVTLQFERSAPLHTEAPVVLPEGPYAQVSLPAQSSPSAEPSKAGESPGESPSPAQTESPGGGG